MVGRNEDDVTDGVDSINIDGQEAFDANVPKRKHDKSRVRDELGSLGVAVSELGERLERVEHSTTKLENTVFTEIGGVKNNLSGFDEQFVQLEEKMMGAVKAFQVSIEALQEDLTL